MNPSGSFTKVISHDSSVCRIESTASDGTIDIKSIIILYDIGIRENIDAIETVISTLPVKLDEDTRRGVFLCGGFLRDTLAGRQSSDIDFYFKNTEAARRFETNIISHRGFLQGHRTIYSFPRKTYNVSGKLFDLIIPEENESVEMHNILMGFDLDICMHGYCLETKTLISSLKFGPEAIFNFNQKEYPLRAFLHVQRLNERFGVRLSVVDTFHFTQLVQSDTLVRSKNLRNVYRGDV